MLEKRLFAALLAIAMPSAVCAQAMMMVPTGGAKPAPVPQTPPADPKDTPEEIAKDAARDLTPSRFYNRPGATRAAYDAAWQQCRLIARSSRTPSGSVPYYYNPAVISPLAAGIGGGIGGAIGAAIAEGQQRRANRQSCLLIRGWRLIEPSAADSAPVLAMTEPARIDYLNRQIGASDVKGKVTERTVFTPPDDPALRVQTNAVEPGSIWLGTKADATAPFAPKPGDATVILAFRRPPGSAAAGRSAVISLMRYDPQKHDLAYQPRDWKKTGDRTSYSIQIKSGDKKAPYEVQVVRLTPGDYVVDSWAAGPVAPMKGNCFGAPTFHVDAGDVGYIGDFVPFWNVKLASGRGFSDLVYAGSSDAARLTLASRQPALAEKLKPLAWRNGATYACSAIMMDRLDLAGAEPLGDQVAGSTSASTVAAH